MEEDIRTVTTQFLSGMLSGLVVGVVVAVVGAIVSHLLIRSRERERWEREERREHATREHEWQLRHRDDRLELYRRFLADLSRMMFSYAYSEDRKFESGPAKSALEEVELIGSHEVREAARSLFDAHEKMGRYLRRSRSGELQEDDPEKAQSQDMLVLHLQESHRLFMDAARKDLGMDFELPDPLEGFDTKA